MQSHLHEVNVAMASAGAWCSERHVDASWLLLRPQVFRRLNVRPETQSVTFPGYPSVTMHFLGSKRIHIIYRTLRYLAGLGIAVWLHSSRRCKGDGQSVHTPSWLLPFPLRQSLCARHTHVHGLTRGHATNTPQCTLSGNGQFREVVPSPLSSSLHGTESNGSKITEVPDGSSLKT